eukprot:286993_1
MDNNKTRNNLIGGVCILIAAVLFETNEAIIKLSNLTVTQLLFGRFVIQFIIAILWWIVNKPENHQNWYGDQPYICNIWIRATLYATTIFLSWYSMKLLPVGDETAIFLTTSVMIAVIAKVFLKEKLQKLFPIILILCVAGSTFIAQPSFLLNVLTKYGYGNNKVEPLNNNGLICLFVAMFGYSFCNILIRTAVKSHFIQLEIVNGGMMIFAGIPLLMLVNQYITNTKYIGSFSSVDWELDIYSILTMLVQGVIGFFSLYFLVMGYQKGEAAKVSMLEYAGIVIACLYQSFIFNDAPNIYETIGIFLIVTSVIFSLLEQYYDYYKSNKHQYDLVNVHTSDGDTIHESDDHHDYNENI